MPFKSEKQRRYLWWAHPELARKWQKKTLARKKVRGRS